jgi:hypothetical protein
MRPVWRIALSCLCFAVAADCHAALVHLFSKWEPSHRVGTGRVLRQTLESVRIQSLSPKNISASLNPIPLVVHAFDPPAATIYSGEFSFKYNPQLFSFAGAGWFGPFGHDPSLPAPPVTSDAFLPEGQEWELQAANPALTQTVTVDEVAGLVAVSFNAGADGLAVSGDNFNFFGLLFGSRATQGDYRIEVSAPGAGDFGIVVDTGRLICSEPIVERLAHVVILTRYHTDSP